MSVLENLLNDEYSRFFIILIGTIIFVTLSYFILKLIIVGSIFCIVGILLFFGSWGARLQSIIDTDSLIILALLHF